MSMSQGCPADRHDFFAFLARMQYINRWGLMRNTQAENIKEHSLDVAMLAHALAVIRNTYFEGTLEPGRAALYGIFHDASEIFTGDMPTPVKHFNPNFKRSFHQLEDRARRKLLAMLPPELSQVLGGGLPVGANRIGDLGVAAILLARSLQQRGGRLVGDAAVGLVADEGGGGGVDEEEDGAEDEEEGEGHKW